MLAFKQDNSNYRVHFSLRLSNNVPKRSTMVNVEDYLLIYKIEFPGIELGAPEKDREPDT
jgi:hypothetical protein